jgi:hypothetical protein
MVRTSMEIFSIRQWEQAKLGLAHSDVDWSRLRFNSCIKIILVHLKFFV